jgi:hypothetical protein
MLQLCLFWREGYHHQFLHMLCVPNLDLPRREDIQYIRNSLSLEGIELEYLGRLY